MSKDQIYEKLMSECFGRNSVPIYGGAYHLTGVTDPDRILKGILGAIEDAKFREPETPAEIVAKNFCFLLLIDHMLYEAYLGLRFSYFDNVSLEELTAFILSL